MESHGIIRIVRRVTPGYPPITTSLTLYFPNQSFAHDHFIASIDSIRPEPQAMHNTNAPLRRFLQTSFPNRRAEINNLTHRIINVNVVCSSRPFLSVTQLPKSLPSTCQRPYLHLINKHLTNLAPRTQVRWSSHPPVSKKDGSAQGKY
jgi:hypothetical protein